MTNDKALQDISINDNKEVGSKVKVTFSIYLFPIVYLLLLVGTYIDLAPIKIAGVIVCLLSIIFASKNQSFKWLAFMTPNLMIFTYKNGGTGLIVLCYLIVFIKCCINEKIRIRKCEIIAIVISILICASRLLQQNFYDLLLLLGVLVAIFDWKYFIDHSTVNEKKGIVRFFAYGSFFLLIGMVFQYFFIVEKTYFAGLMDDSNYTAGVFAFLFSIMLYFVFNRIQFRSKYIFLVLALAGGLLTSSRAFLLAIGFVVLFYFIYGLLSRKARKVVYISIALIVLFFVLYLLNFGPAVTLYQKTIGRTIALRETYVEGNFMDISSGRFTLWAYYSKQFLSDAKIFFFGKGFKIYYLEEYGGYATSMAAHNSFIAGIMGIGVIGTISVLYLYFHINQNKKLNIIDYSLMINFLVTYFFLDGLLDFRLSLFFALFSMAVCIRKETVIINGETDGQLRN